MYTAGFAPPRQSAPASCRTPDRHARSASDRSDAAPWRHRGAGAGRRRRVLGPRHRRRRHRGRRGVLQHRDERLSGDPDRPVLRRPDHHLHLPPYRQCRHQCGGRGDRHAGGARAGAAQRHHRSVELARHPASRWLAEGQRPGRRHRRRHAAADPPGARRRRAQRRAVLRARRPARHRRPARQGRRLAGAGRHGPRQGRVLPAAL